MTSPLTTLYVFYINSTLKLILEGKIYTQLSCCQEVPTKPKSVYAWIFFTSFCLSIIYEVCIYPTHLTGICLCLQYTRCLHWVNTVLSLPTSSTMAWLSSTLKERSCTFTAVCNWLTNLFSMRFILTARWQMEQCSWCGVLLHYLLNFTVLIVFVLVLFNIRTRYQGFEVIEILVFEIRI